MERVDIVDSLLALVHLTLHPVPIKVPEHVVDVLGSGGVSVPFLDVVVEEGFVLILEGFFAELGKMFFEERNQVLVKFVAQKMRTCGVSPCLPKSETQPLTSTVSCAGE